MSLHRIVDPSTEVRMEANGLDPWRDDGGEA